MEKEKAVEMRKQLSGFIRKINSLAKKENCPLRLSCSLVQDGWGLLDKLPNHYGVQIRTQMIGYTSFSGFVSRKRK